MTPNYVTITIAKLVGSIYGRSSMKIVHFGSIRSKHGRHRQFLMLIGEDFLEINQSAIRIAYGGHVC
jgi:hypothetical protein